MKVRATLEAILDILGGHVEIHRDGGVAIDRSRPGGHRANVPARDHALLDDWFALARGRREQVDGAGRWIRGAEALALLDEVLARTMPLVHGLLGEGRPREAARWLERFGLHVDRLRGRAVADAVTDDIDARAGRRLGQAPCAEVVRRLSAPLAPLPVPPRGDPLRWLGLERCLRELQRHARTVHADAVRFEVALTAATEPATAEFARALAAQTDGLRRNLRDLHLGPYLERIHAPRRHDDPGRYPQVSARLSPLLALPATTDVELLAACDALVAIAIACVDDAAEIIAETFARPAAPPTWPPDACGRPPGVPAASTSGARSAPEQARAGHRDRTPS